MNTKSLSMALSAAKQVVKTSAKKHSPKLLFIGGAVGVVAGVVMAVKAGKISEEEIRKADAEIADVHSRKNYIPESEGNYTIDDYRKELAIAYAKKVGTIAKVYGPAALTTAASLVLLGKSNHILSDRSAKNYAAFVAMAEAYDAYRARVIEAEGMDADKRYRLGIKNVVMTTPILDKNGEQKIDKNGNPKVEKKNVDILSDFDLEDPRTALFSEETCPWEFNTDPDDTIRHDCNLTHILNVQNAANHVLKTQGYIFLNDVRKMLGLKPIDVGFLLGWIYDPFNREHIGDNCVDFGLQDPDAGNWERKLAFLSGDEDAVLLEMNYDGPIWDKIGVRTRRVKA